VSRYGNDDQFQKNLIKGVNSFFKPPLEWIQKGMCYMLALDWILKYLAEPAKRQNTAERVFDAITSNIAELRMIANNYAAYAGDILEIEQGKTRDMELRRMEYLIKQTAAHVSILSRNTRTATPYLPTFNLVPTPTALGKIHIIPRKEAYFILFLYEAEGNMHGHAVGMIADKEGDYRIYDPNYGIIRATVISDVFASVLPQYTKNFESIKVNVMLIK